MAALSRGTLMGEEGAGKDRRFTKHGRDWRVRTVKVAALATHAPTRGGQPTATIGGAYSITVTALTSAGKVERDAARRPIPFATALLTIDAEALARQGVVPVDKLLEAIDRALDAAAVRRANLVQLDAMDAEFASTPDELSQPAALPSVPASGAPVPTPIGGAA